MFFCLSQVYHADRDVIKPPAGFFQPFLEWATSPMAVDIGVVPDGAIALLFKTLSLLTRHYPRLCDVLYRYPIIDVDTSLQARPGVCAKCQALLMEIVLGLAKRSARYVVWNQECFFHFANPERHDHGIPALRITARVLKHAFAWHPDLARDEIWCALLSRDDDTPFERKVGIVRCVLAFLQGTDAEESNAFPQPMIELLPGLLEPLIDRDLVDGSKADAIARELVTRLDLGREFSELALEEEEKDESPGNDPEAELFGFDLSLEPVQTDFVLEELLTEAADQAGAGGNGDLHISGQPVVDSVGVLAGPPMRPAGAIEDHGDLPTQEARQMLCGDMFGVLAALIQGQEGEAEAVEPQFTAATDQTGTATDGHIQPEEEDDDEDEYYDEEESDDEEGSYEEDGPSRLLRKSDLGRVMRLDDGVRARE
jgi:hypothetical protein